MKLFLFIICISATITACKKGDLGPVNLVGTWELRHYSGTIAGVSKDLPSGNGKLIQFSTDSTFKRFTDFKQDAQGKFRIVKGGINWGGAKYDGIFFDDKETGDIIILKADSLTIENAFPDGVTSLYIKQTK